MSCARARVVAVPRRLLPSTPSSYRARHILYERVVVERVSDRVVVERVSDRGAARLTMRQLQHRVLSFVVQRASAKAMC